MISHEYKCIFVHIPCTGGTSIEEWICDKDYWHINKAEKHIMSCQAKEIYKDYWDDYFKFSIVRHPYTRTHSMLKDPQTFGIKITEEKHLDFTRYLNHYGFPVTLEYDYRFYKRSDIHIEKPEPHCVYKNFLSEKLDYVYRFEDGHSSIQKDLSYRLSIPIRPLRHLQKSTKTINIDNFVECNTIYQRDFTQYKYNMKVNKSQCFTFF